MPEEEVADGCLSFAGSVSSTCLRFSGTRTDGDTGKGLFNALSELVLKQIGGGVLLAEEALGLFYPLTVTWVS